MAWNPLPSWFESSQKALWNCQRRHFQSHLLRLVFVLQIQQHFLHLVSYLLCYLLCPCLLAGIIYPLSACLQSAVSSDWWSSVWSCRGLITRACYLSSWQRGNSISVSATKWFPRATPLSVETTHKVALLSPLSPHSIQRPAICQRQSVSVCVFVWR